MEGCHMTEASNCNVSRRDLLEAGVAAGVASLRSPTATRPRRSCRTRPCAGRWRSTGTASPDVVYSKSISPAAWQPPVPFATADQRWATVLKHELGLSVGKTIFGFALSWRVKYGTPTRNDVAPLSV